MPKIILDTSVLVTHPDILAKAGPEARFVIPEAVLYELGASNRRDSAGGKLLELLKNAVDQAVVEVWASDDEIGATSADISIARLLKEAAASGSELILATEDRDLARVGAELGVPVLDIAGLESRLSVVRPQEGSSIAADAKKLVNAQRLDLILKVLVGVGISTAGNLVATRFSTIIETINVWGTLVGLVCLAGLLYWFRGRYRLAYGTAEFIVGFSAAARVFWPRFVYSDVQPADIFQVVGGLYIMIRGLDNVGKAVSGTRWERPWRRLSGESQAL